MGPDGGFITGSDILMDGGVTFAHWHGELAEVRAQREDDGAPKRLPPPVTSASGRQRPRSR